MAKERGEVCVVEESETGERDRGERGGSETLVPRREVGVQGGVVRGFRVLGLGCERRAEGRERLSLSRARAPSHTHRGRRGQLLNFRV